MGSQITNVQQDKQCTISQGNHPWLDERGFPLSDEQLRSVSRSWDEATWNKYLEWHETPRAESLLRPQEYDEACEKLEESVFVDAQSSADDELKTRIGMLLSSLTDQQRRVLEPIFWQGWSERRVAQELKLNHKSVHRLKERALNKISKLLKGGPSSRIMRGEISPLHKETGEMDGKKVLGLADRKIQKAG